MLLTNVRMYQQLFKNYPDAVDFEQYRQMLGLGRNRAYELLRTGQIPCRRNGKNTSLPKSILLNF